MALLHFRDAGVDAQVIEVGLGGELDSTNVVAPSVCAITNISFDHVAVLGPTIESIARAKAGIIKPGVPVVLAPQMEGALEVALGVAARQRAPVTQVGSDVRWAVDDAAGGRQGLRVETSRGCYRIDLPLDGDYQGKTPRWRSPRARSSWASAWIMRRCCAAWRTCAGPAGWSACAGAACR